MERRCYQDDCDKVDDVGLSFIHCHPWITISILLGLYFLWRKYFLPVVSECVPSDCESSDSEESDAFQCLNPFDSCIMPPEEPENCRRDSDSRFYSRKNRKARDRSRDFSPITRHYSRSSINNLRKKNHCEPSKP